MLDTIIIIILCLLILGGVFDFILDLFGLGFKVICAIVLVCASIYLGFKLFVAFIPWMFCLTVIAFILGVVWLIKAIFEH